MELPPSAVSSAPHVRAQSGSQPSQYAKPPESAEALTLKQMIDAVYPLEDLSQLALTTGAIQCLNPTCRMKFLDNHGPSTAAFVSTVRRPPVEDKDPSVQRLMVTFYLGGHLIQEKLKQSINMHYLPRKRRQGRASLRMMGNSSGEVNNACYQYLVMHVNDLIHLEDVSERALSSPGPLSPAARLQDLSSPSLARGTSLQLATLGAIPSAQVATAALVLHRPLGALHAGGDRLQGSLPQAEGNPSESMRIPLAQRSVPIDNRALSDTSTAKGYVCDNPCQAILRELERYDGIGAMNVKAGILKLLVFWSRMEEHMDPKLRRRKGNPFFGFQAHSVACRANEMKKTLHNFINFWRFHTIHTSSPPAEGPAGLSGGVSITPSAAKEWDAMISNQGLTLREAAAAFVGLFPPLLIEGMTSSIRKTGSGQSTLYMKRAWAVTYRFLKEMLERAKSYNKVFDKGSGSDFDVDETLAAFELCAIVVDPRTLFSSWKSKLLSILARQASASTNGHICYQLCHYERLHFEGKSANLVSKAIHNFVRKWIESPPVSIHDTDHPSSSVTANDTGLSGVTKPGEVHRIFSTVIYPDFEIRYGARLEAFLVDRERVLLHTSSPSSNASPSHDHTGASDAANAAFPPSADQPLNGSQRDEQSEPGDRDGNVRGRDSEASSSPPGALHPILRGPKGILHRKRLKITREFQDLSLAPIIVDCDCLMVTLQSVDWKRHVPPPSANTLDEGPTGDAATGPEAGGNATGILPFATPIHSVSLRLWRANATVLLQLANPAFRCTSNLINTLKDYLSQPLDEFNSSNVDSTESRDGQRDSLRFSQPRLKSLQNHILSYGNLVGDLMCSRTGRKAAIICDFLRNSIQQALTESLMEREVTISEGPRRQRESLLPSSTAPVSSPTVIPMYLSYFLDQSVSLRRGVSNNTLLMALESYKPSVSHSPANIGFMATIPTDGIVKGAFKDATHAALKTLLERFAINHSITGSSSTLSQFGLNSDRNHDASHQGQASAVPTAGWAQLPLQVFAVRMFNVSGTEDKRSGLLRPMHPLLFKILARMPSQGVEAKATIQDLATLASSILPRVDAEAGASAPMVPPESLKGLYQAVMKDCVSIAKWFETVKGGWNKGIGALSDAEQQLLEKSVVFTDVLFVLLPSHICADNQMRWKLSGSKATSCPQCCLTGKQYVDPETASIRYPTSYRVADGVSPGTASEGADSQAQAADVEILSADEAKEDTGVDITSEGAAYVATDSSGSIQSQNSRGSVTSGTAGANSYYTASQYQSPDDSSSSGFSESCGSVPGAHEAMKDGDTDSDQGQYDSEASEDSTRAVLRPQPANGALAAPSPRPEASEINGLQHPPDASVPPVALPTSFPRRSQQIRVAEIKAQEQTRSFHIAIPDLLTPAFPLSMMSDCAPSMFANSETRDVPYSVAPWRPSFLQATGVFSILPCDHMHDLLQGLVPKVVHLLGQSLKCDKSVVALVLEAMNAQGLKLSMANRLSIPKFKELCNADRIGWDTLLAMSVSDPEISRRRPLPLSASVSAGRAPSQVAWSSSLKLRLRSAEGKRKELYKALQAIPRYPLKGLDELVPSSLNVSSTDTTNRFLLILYSKMPITLSIPFPLRFHIRRAIFHITQQYAISRFSCLPHEWLSTIKWIVNRGDSSNHILDAATILKSYEALTKGGLGQLQALFTTNPSDSVSTGQAQLENAGVGSGNRRSQRDTSSSGGHRPRLPRNSLTTLAMRGSISMRNADIMQRLKEMLGPVATQTKAVKLHNPVHYPSDIERFGLPCPSTDTFEMVHKIVNSYTHKTSEDLSTQHSVHKSYFGYRLSKGIGGHVMGLEETAAQFPLVPDKDNNFSLLDSVGSLFLGKSSPVSNLTTPISVIQEIILQRLLTDDSFKEDPDLARLVSQELTSHAEVYLNAQLWNGKCSISLQGSAGGKDNTVRIAPLYSRSRPLLMAIDATLVLGRAGEYLHHWMENSSFPDREAVDKLTYRDAYIVGVLLQPCRRLPSAGQNGDITASGTSSQGGQGMPPAIRASLDLPPEYWNQTNIFSDELIEGYEVVDPTPVLVPISYIYDNDITIAAPSLWCFLSEFTDGMQGVSLPTGTTFDRTSGSLAQVGATSGLRRSSRRRGRSDTLSTAGEHSLVQPHGAQQSQTESAPSASSEVQSVASGNRSNGYTRVEKRMILLSRRLRLPWKSVSTLLHTYPSSFTESAAAEPFGILPGVQPRDFIRDVKSGGLIPIGFEL